MCPAFAALIPCCSEDAINTPETFQTLIKLAPMMAMTKCNLGHQKNFILIILPHGDRSEMNGNFFDYENGGDLFSRIIMIKPKRSYA
jgi:hypothetical protein